MSENFNIALWQNFRVLSIKLSCTFCYWRLLFKLILSFKNRWIYMWYINSAINVYFGTDRLCMHILVQYFLYKKHCHFIDDILKMFKSCHMSLRGSNESNFWYMIWCYADMLFKTNVINNTKVLNVMSYPLRILRYNRLCYMFSRNTKLVLSICWFYKNETLVKR